MLAQIIIGFIVVLIIVAIGIAVVLYVNSTKLPASPSTTPTPAHIVPDPATTDMTSPDPTTSQTMALPNTAVSPTMALPNTAVSPTMALPSMPAPWVSPCSAMNSNYVLNDAASWTSNDRNTAVWLINSIAGVPVALLGAMSNDKLKPLVDNLCIQPINCAAANSNYVPKDPSAWTDNDRNTAVWLLSRGGADAAFLGSLSNAKLYPMLHARCV